MSHNLIYHILNKKLKENEMDIIQEIMQIVSEMTPDEQMKFLEYITHNMDSVCTEE